VDCVYEGLEGLGRGEEIGEEDASGGEITKVEGIEDLPDLSWGGLG
jgi:hypothetical protein